MTVARATHRGPLNLRPARGLGVAIVPDVCDLPKGCLGVSLEGLPPQPYGLISLPDPPHAEASARLSGLIRDHLQRRRGAQAHPPEASGVR
jgi:hypothetical protein